MIIPFPIFAATIAGMQAYPLSFDNSQQAFAHKSDKELKRARFLFSTMSHHWLVKLGTRLTPWGIKIGLPLKTLIRKTIFDQFVGGENLKQTARVASKLEKFGVKVILDYGVEGKEGEHNFDQACEEFVRVVEYAAKQHNIPFISIKVTGFARFALLEKLDKAAESNSGYMGEIKTEVLDQNEKLEWERVVVRIEQIIRAAAESHISVLVDAEETWVQDPVDAITMQLMEKYNKERAVVYNTIQLYRTDRLPFLKRSLAQAQHKGFVLGVKLVRGAYMEKERRRAEEHSYRSPIQPDKVATDQDYDRAVAFSIGHIEHMAIVVASHNEQSNLFATELMEHKKLPHDHPRIHFSQLFGMSDHISFNLAANGYSVSKYLPFGPINDVIPYLMRRAQENSSVNGQTGRELLLIKKEIKRRNSGG